MSAEVIQEFLVELGWSVNKEGQKAFSDALAGARKTALGLAAGLAAVAAAVVSTADAYSRMGYEARNAGSSVSGMQSLNYAIRQMGGSADGVRASLQHISNFMRFGGPGAENVFNRIGISTRDARGHIRDTSDMLEDFFSRARNMPQYQARAYADLFGIDTNTLIAGEADPHMLHRERDQYRDIYRRLGIDPDQAAKQSQEMMRQVNRLTTALQAVGEKITLSLIHAFGGKDLDSFTNYLLSHSDEISSSIQSLINIIIQMARTVIDATKQVNSLVEGTVGWKNALIGVFGLFAASKLLPVITGLGRILTLLMGIQRVGGAAAAAAAAVEGGAATAAGVGTGIAAAALPTIVGTGAVVAGYDAYKGTQLVHRMWENAHKPESRDVQDRQDQAMRFFQSMGLTRAQSAGVVGNLTRESQLDVNTVGDNGHAHGIAQWHLDRARKIYEDFSIDVNHSTLAQQLKAVYLEATQGEDPQARLAWAQVQKARTADEAAHAFRRYYERPLDAKHNEDSIRSSLASQILDRSVTTHSPSQVNHITVSMGSTASPSEVASSVSSSVRNSWDKMNMSNVPRRQGLLGKS